MASSNYARVRKDISSLVVNEYEVLFCDCTLPEQALVFITLFEGPKNTLYRDGIWYIKFFVSKEYPSKPPGIKFLNRIFHPNIDDPSGIVCMDVLSTQWQVNFNFLMILEFYLPQLLLSPNPDDALNCRASIFYTFSPEKYQQTVFQFVKKYGIGDILSIDEAAEIENEKQMALESILNGTDSNENSDDDTASNDSSRTNCADVDFLPTEKN